MKTFVTIEIDHAKPIPHLADMVAGRAWSIGGVTSAEVGSVTTQLSSQQMLAAGFTLEEISLGAGEVARS